MTTEINERLAQTLSFVPDHRYEVVLVGLSSDASSDVIERIRVLIDSETEVTTQTWFEVQAQPNGEFARPDYYGVLEHSAPREPYVVSLLADDYLENFNLLTSAFFQVSEPTTVPLREDKCYEFFAAWLNQSKETLLQTFFAESQPIKEQYGRPEPLLLVQLAPVLTNYTADQSFHPSLGGIVEWDDHKDVEVLLSNEAFMAKAAPLFAEAVHRIEMVLGKIVV